MGWAVKAPTSRRFKGLSPRTTRRPSNFTRPWFHRFRSFWTKSIVPLSRDTQEKPHASCCLDWRRHPCAMSVEPLGWFTRRTRAGHGSYSGLHAARVHAAAQPPTWHHEAGEFISSPEPGPLPSIPRRIARGLQSGRDCVSAERCSRELASLHVLGLRHNDALGSGPVCKQPPT